LTLKPRAIGSILRSLGFTAQRLSAAGRGTTLLNSVRQRIHDLAWSYDLLERDLRPGDCEQCRRLDPEVTKYLDGKLSRRIAGATPGELENPLKYDSPYDDVD